MASTHDFENLQYQSGFGNHFESEALSNALPRGQNNPRVCPFGLYSEQLSGTAFTAPRKDNKRSWLYRIKPSVTHEPFQQVSPQPKHLSADFSEKHASITPNQLRWLPFPIPTEPTNFVDGLYTVCGTGSPEMKQGYAIHVYTSNTSMDGMAFANADGDFLIVPQQGCLQIVTELGRMHVKPGEVVVIPMGLRYAVGLPNGASRGYVLEVFGTHFCLPDLGPIGANGLANPRDFLTPVAWYDDRPSPGFRVVHKFEGLLFEAAQDFSPFNVVAWHGNYVPYKYDLERFCPMNAVAYDHPDPSIFTVLTCPSSQSGVAAVDFVLFPPRWTVAEHTFRPPYFHRNYMNEFMGLIRGVYEGKSKGFQPGGASLHSCMTPHGPDTETFEKAIREDETLQPVKLPSDTLAFMFESCFTPRITLQACTSPQTDKEYYKCWMGLRSHFDPTRFEGLP